MSLFDTHVVNNETIRVSEAIAINDRLSMSPDVAAGGDGTVWAVWSQQDPEAGEQICARQFADSEVGTILKVSTQTGIEFQPCITNLAHGSLRVFWIARREGLWRLMTRSFRGETFADEATVATSTDGLFSPRAAIDATGNCWVVCEKVVGQRTRIAAFRQAKNAWIHLPFETLEGDCYRPDVCLGPGRTLWVSYDEFGHRESTTDGLPVTGNYRVAVQPIPGSAPIDDDADSELDRKGEQANLNNGQLRHIADSIFIVSDSGYQNVQTSLSADADGNLWIALASNRNAERRDPAWLTKWSYLYHFDGTGISEPVAHRPDVDLYNEHAYQGWEFPAVGVDKSGAVLLVGQSAHSILAQSYTGDSWSRTNTIIAGKWGSWKPRCRIAGTGPMFVVSMSPAGAGIQRIDFVDQPVGRVAAPLLVSRSEPLPAQCRPETQTRAGERPTVQDIDGTVYSVYFGDLHAHSAYSDAVGDVDELYHRYRDLYGYDFAALTDHDYLDGIELSRSELALIWNHADRFSTEQEFLAWYAYEWTSPAISEHAAEGAHVGEGHRHILYPDQSGPLISYGNPDSNTGAKLLSKLKGVRALVIPHHTSWSGTDWDAHDPELQRVVEIVSTHGRFEHPGNKPIGYRRDHVHTEKMVLAALDRGYKLGFVGGSDSHGLRWHAIELEGRAKHIPEGTRVGWKEDAYRTGMTAILAEDLTRESLFSALHERRCYATSGAPIFLDFRINGEIMGSQISVLEQPRLTATIVGTSAIRMIEVIRSGHVFGGMQMSPGEGIAKVNFSLEDTMLIPGESAYYYLRVLQEDGNMAWSSPIWVKYD